MEKLASTIPSTSLSKAGEKSLFSAAFREAAQRWFRYIQGRVGVIYVYAVDYVIENAVDRNFCEERLDI